MKRQSLHVKDNAIYDQFTKQQVIWTHGYGATDRYVTRNEWGALLLQWPVPTYTTSKAKLTSGSYFINLPAMSTILAYNDSAKFGRIWQNSSLVH